MLSAQDALIVGLIQGVTEWLPISSKTQLMLFLLYVGGLSAPSAFSLSLLLQVPSVVAPLILYRKSFSQVLTAVANPREAGEGKHLAKFLVSATFTTGALGIPLYFIFRKTLPLFRGHEAMILLGLMLMIVGVALAYSRKWVGRRRMDTISFLDSLFAGATQALSIAPGLSRSGLTMTALLYRGFNPRDVVHLSFLLSVPALLGAFALDIVAGGENAGIALLYSIGPQNVIISFAAALISSLLTIKALAQASVKVNFSLFCLFFGLLIVLLNTPFVL